ncbi:MULTISPECIES: TetR/AcrR family transcriptional regulator [unclassified Nocardioides]|uniref:TetR/AcrR family transcriptional regulator n=1 Tax=unclassified Nocardioides TaxID=2615069 RepID=UPI00005700B6|nr:MULTISPECIES: TetR/AcrR family transcriptional regulator [unclassified Nocardioides]ABL80496.1 transcriptional regulator, TetR family [Nocardioides sp. JS614]
MTGVHEASGRSKRRDALLDAAVDHVIDHGLAGLSIRNLADALGVAHNTLTYHFGSRAELLQALFSRLAQRIRRTSAVGGSDPAHLDAVARSEITATWQWLSADERRGMWTTFFEVFVLAIREPDTYRGVLDHLAEDWVNPLADQMRAAGFADDAARARATLVVAAVRGLVLELQSTTPDQHDRVDGAIDALLDVVGGWVSELGPSESG